MWLLYAAKNREIGEVFVRKKLAVLALWETELKGWGDGEFGVNCGRRRSWKVLLEKVYYCY